MTDLAAVLGAIGAAAILTAGRRVTLLGGLAVVALATVWNAVRTGRIRPIRRDIAWPSAAFLAFASLSMMWSEDVGSARNLIEYFLLPFAVLVVVVAHAPFPARMPRILGTISIALAVLFALVGLAEAATHRLIFYAHNLQVSNTYTSFFRVTSLFRDPSLYGRHLVLGIAIVVVCMWLRKLDVVPAAVLVALLFAGLYFSYSQSSYAALFVVVLAITLAAGDRRARRVAVVAAVAVLLVGTGIAAAKVVHSSVRKATSDRSRRIELTARAFAHHPLAGVGLGGQPRASQKLATRFGPLQNFVSHTTPLTVAAELGIVGLLAYVGILVGAAHAIHDVRRRQQAVGLSLAAVFLALFVHSLAYSGFFEDPITWLVVGIAAAFVPSIAVGTPVPEAPRRREPVEAR